MDLMSLSWPEFVRWLGQLERPTATSVIAFLALGLGLAQFYRNFFYTRHGLLLIPVGRSQRVGFDPEPDSRPFKFAVVNTRWSTLGTRTRFSLKSYLCTGQVTIVQAGRTFRTRPRPCWVPC